MTPLSSPALDTVRANALYLLKEALESIRNQDAYEQTGRPYVEAAYFYRRVALCELLADARTDRFFVYLCKSAQVRLSLLQRVAGGHPAQKPYTCASKNFSFMDALAAGQLGLASELARLTTDRHEPTQEYEEDFLLHHFLHQLAGAAVELQPLLARWEAVVGTDITCHLELCQALHTRDSQRFNRALKDAITQRAAAFKEQKNDSGPKDAALTEAHVHITGLALIRLAELRDMETLHEYPTLPRLARIPPGRTPPPADSWLHPALAVPA
ncbi:Imm49 family immunity protein [Pyxidicoccus trucidator]|uniref:Imm49 family immunity protein n=1 Tax=Pyxidicoccus trucidator TaxID=2709662 RepID=UPI0013DD7AA9|nr:Imm49 family immunity protein [Pyxidicoccus trucidator]